MITSEPGEDMVAGIHRNSLQPGYRLMWYRIEQILGQGSFGITYLALDQNLEQQVAIKEYLPVENAVRESNSRVFPVSPEHRNRYQKGLERFISEARTLAKFNHPNIVRVLSVFEENATAYMVMNYEEGESLRNILKRRELIEERELKAYILPILEGLSEVHAAGFIHRDIKPSNIFIRRDGTPVLLDFGSARQALGEQTRTLTSVVSPGYAPFEQYDSQSDRQGPWTDIYGLGATLYRVVAGVPPMDAIGRTLSILKTSKDTLVPAVEIGRGRYSEVFLRAVDHALQFYEGNRPQSAMAWYTELNGGIPMHRASSGAVRGPSPAETLSESTRRTQPRVGAAKGRRSPWVMVVMLVLATVGAVLWQYHAPLSKQWQALVTNGARFKATPDEARDEQNTFNEILARARQDLVNADLGDEHVRGLLNRYRTVLLLDPANEEAKSGIERIKARYLALAETAFSEKRYVKAERYIGQVAQIAPDEPRIVQIKAGIEQDRERESARNQQVAALLHQARSDIAADRLTSPPGNNALERLRQVKELRPNDGRVKQGLIDLGNRLMELADVASRQGRFGEAYAYLDEAEAILPDRPEIKSARDYVDIRRLSPNRGARDPELGPELDF